MLTYQRQITKAFFIDGGLSLTTRGGESDFFMLENFWIAYVQVPVGVSYKFFPGSSKYSVMLSGSIAPGFDIGTSIGMPRNNNLSEPRQRYHDWDASVGATLLRGKWGINLQYCYGLKTISELKDFYSLSNRSVNLALVYKLKG